MRSATSMEKTDAWKIFLRMFETVRWMKGFLSFLFYRLEKVSVDGTTRQRTKDKDMEIEKQLWERGYFQDARVRQGREFERLRDETGKKKVYLDSAGSSLYSRTQIERFHALLSERLIRNPHSCVSEDPRDGLRKACLDHCNASHEEYVCLIVSSATDAIHKAVEMMPWSSSDTYLYARSSHTSLIGARNVPLSWGANARPFRLHRRLDVSERIQTSRKENHDGWDSKVHRQDAKDDSPDDLDEETRVPWWTVDLMGTGFTRVSAIADARRFGRYSGDGRHPFVLMAMPHECNASGIRQDLSAVDEARCGRLLWQEEGVSMQEDEGFPGRTQERDGFLSTGQEGQGARVFVLLDAARSGGTLPPDLSLHGPDFVAFSFYKIFGFPTSGGALLVRKETLAWLNIPFHSRLSDRNCAFTVQEVPSPSLVEAGGTGESGAHAEGNPNSHVDDTVSLDFYPKKRSGPTALGQLTDFLPRVPFGGGTLLACTPDRDCILRKEVPEGLEAGSPDFLGHHAALIGFQYLKELGGSLPLFKHSIALTNHALERMSAMKHSANGSNVFQIYGRENTTLWQRQEVVLHARPAKEAWNSSVSGEDFSIPKRSHAPYNKQASLSRASSEFHEGNKFRRRSGDGSGDKVPKSMEERKIDQSNWTHPFYTHGPTIAFNICRVDGSLVGHSEVVFLAELNGIFLRGGRFCNPGAASSLWNVNLESLIVGSSAGLDCGQGGVDFLDGVPTGALRISFGYYNTLEDLHDFFHFVEKYFVSSGASAKGSPEPGVPSRIKPGISWETADRLLLKKIIIYPIKSCAGQEVNQWPCQQPSGLLYDREWVLVDRVGKALSTKTNPKLQTIEPFLSLERETLFLRTNLRGHGMASKLVLAISLVQGVATRTKHGHSSPQTSPAWTEGVLWAEHESDPVVAEWLESALGEHVVLVRKAKGDASFANRGSFHLISEQSLADLEKRLQNVHGTGMKQAPSIGWQNFRPNLVVDGRYPYQEDNLVEYRVGNNMVLNLCQSCVRCTSINLGQNAQEPLHTLSQYRLTRSGVTFGTLLSMKADSTLSDGIVHTLHIGQEILAVPTVAN